MDRSPLELLPQFHEDAFVYYRRLRKVKEAVCTDPITALSRNQAAAIAGMSPSHFSVFFSEKVGIPYSRWVKVLRLRAAIGLMASANYGIAEIAERSGFADTRSFQRAARSLTGRTPTELRDTALDSRAVGGRTE